MKVKLFHLTSLFQDMKVHSVFEKVDSELLLESKPFSLSLS